MIFHSDLGGVETDTQSFLGGRQRDDGSLATSLPAAPEDGSERPGERSRNLNHGINCLSTSGVNACVGYRLRGVSRLAQRAKSVR